MKKPPKDDKSIANLHIRLPAEELKDAKAEAKRSGFDFTTWLRLLMRKATGKDRR